MKASRNAFRLHKSNNRWKWMVGATAATAAGVGVAQASTITINLVNNYIGNGNYGGNHLNLDLTGDGHPDLTIANASYTLYFVKGSFNGVRASAHTSNDNVNMFAQMRLGSRTASYAHPFNGGTGSTSGTPSLVGSIPIFFKDLHIKGGAPTEGLLEVTVSGGLIQLDSFTYNSNTQVASRSVPDQGSSLALLATGAGGVLALRRLRFTQAHS
jgi:protein with PEP-CTERM/exosortase system signal